MLALKRRQRPGRTGRRADLIFDEVDAGMGGGSDRRR
jgi:DNA repair ATPase RecN